MTSILESKYVEPEWPPSQKEMQNKLNMLFRRIRIGKVKAHHRRCGHCYLTRMNGRKEKDILVNNNVDNGNCSVCWKLSKTPRKLLSNAIEMVESYQKNVNNDLTAISYNELDLINVFYTWLYTEFN